MYQINIHPESLPWLTLFSLVDGKMISLYPKGLPVGMSPLFQVFGKTIISEFSISFLKSGVLLLRPKAEDLRPWMFQLVVLVCELEGSCWVGGVSLSWCLWVDEASLSLCLWVDGVSLSRCLWVDGVSLSRCLWVDGVCLSRCLWVEEISLSLCLWVELLGSWLWTWCESCCPVKSGMTLSVSWSFCDREASSLLWLSLSSFTISVRAHSAATWLSGAAAALCPASVCSAPC